MTYQRPDKIPCRDNGQPLYKFPKKGATEAPDSYDIWKAYFHVKNHKDVVWEDNPVWHGELEFVELYSTGGSGDPYKITCVLRHTTLGHFYALPYEHYVTVMKYRGFTPKLNDLSTVTVGNWQFERRGPYCTLVPVD